MNRAVNKTEDPTKDTAIRLEPSAALDSGYGHFPHDGDLPPRPRAGYAQSKYMNESPRKAGLRQGKDGRGDGDFTVNKNSSYLKSVASTMDFLLEVSRDPSIWRDKEDKESPSDKEMQQQGKKLSRNNFEHKDFASILERPRYRLSSMEDAVLLSEQFDQLPLEDFCRIMKFVGYDFEREIIQESVRENEDLSRDLFSDKMKKEGKRSKRRVRENKKERNKYMGRLVNEDKMKNLVESRDVDGKIKKQKSNKQWRGEYETQGSARERFDKHITQKDNTEGKPRARYSATSVECHMESEARVRTDLAIEKENLDDDMQSGKKTASCLQDNPFLLGGGESDCRKIGENETRGDQDNHLLASTRSVSVMLGGGDHLESLEKADTVVHTDNSTSSRQTPQIPVSGEITAKQFSDIHSSQQSWNVPGCISHDQSVTKYPIYSFHSSRQKAPPSLVSCNALKGSSPFNSDIEHARATSVEQTTAEPYVLVSDECNKLPGNITRQGSDPSRIIKEKLNENNYSSKLCITGEASTHCQSSYIAYNSPCAINIPERSIIQNEMQNNQKQKRPRTAYQEGTLAKLPTKKLDNLVRANEWQYTRSEHCNKSIACCKLSEGIHKYGRQFEFQLPVNYVKNYDANFMEERQTKSIEIDIFKDHTGEKTPDHSILRNDSVVENISRSSNTENHSVNRDQILESTASFQDRLACQEKSATSFPKENIQNFERAPSSSDSCTSIYSCTLVQNVKNDVSCMLENAPLKSDRLAIQRSSKVLCPIYITAMKACQAAPSSKNGARVMQPQSKSFTQPSLDRIADNTQFEKLKILPVHRQLTHTISPDLGEQVLCDSPDFHEQKLESTDKPKAYLTEMLKKPVHSPAIKATIDQFVSVSDAIEINASCTQSEKPDDSKASKHLSCLSRSQTLTKPMRSFGLGLSAEGIPHGVHHVDHTVDGFRNSALKTDHHLRKLTMCQRWVEQNYPFICEKELRRVEKQRNPSMKLFTNRSQPQGPDGSDVCGRDISHQKLVDSFCRVQTTGGLVGSKKDKRLDRTDRRTFTVQWVDRHDALFNPSQGFHTPNCKKRKHFSDQHHKGSVKKVVNKNKDSFDLFLNSVKDTSNMCHPTLSSTSNDHEKQDGMNNNTKLEGFLNPMYEKRQLDQNFNKTDDKKRGKKDRKLDSGGKKKSSSKDRKESTSGERRRRGNRDHGSKRDSRGSSKSYQKYGRDESKRYGDKRGSRGSVSGRKGSISERRSGRSGSRGSRRGREGSRSRRGGNRPERRDSRPGRGGSRPESRDSRPGRGGSRPESRDSRPGRGGSRPESRDSRPGRGGSRPESRDSRPGRRGSRPERRDSRPGRGGSRPERRDSRPGRGGRGPESRDSRPGRRGRGPESKGSISGKEGTEGSKRRDRRDRESRKRGGGEVGKRPDSRSREKLKKGDSKGEKRKRSPRLDKEGGSRDRGHKSRKGSKVSREDESQERSTGDKKEVRIDSRGRRFKKPGILSLFGVSDKKRRRDRWAAYRPQDNRTLEEDLAMLKQTLGEAGTTYGAGEEEDIEVPLFFIYFGMCLFLVFGAIVNVELNDGIKNLYESIYFVYVLCSTSGFGDILPDPKGYLFQLLYGLTGVSMFNITVNATLQYMMATLDYLKLVVKKP